jgi:hypothetical protein
VDPVRARVSTGRQAEAAIVAGSSRVARFSFHHDAVGGLLCVFCVVCCRGRFVGVISTFKSGRKSTQQRKPVNQHIHRLIG